MVKLSPAAWCSILSCTAILLGLSYATLWADTLRIRYQEYPCQFSAITTDRGAADVVVIGNSRSMRAINASQLSTALGHSVLDLSRSWRGQEHTYAILNDYLGARRPKLLLVEFNRGPGKSRRYHPHTPLTLTYGQLFSLAVRDEGRDLSLYERLAWAIRVVLERTAKRLGDLIAGHVQSEAVMLTHLDAGRDCTTENEAIRVEDNLTRRTHDWAAGATNWDLGAREPGNDLYSESTLEIIALAQAHGVPIALYFVPKLAQPPVSEDFSVDVENRFGVPFLVPTPSLHLQLFEPKRYRDPTHLTLNGSALFAEWFAREIVDRALIASSP